MESQNLFSATKGMMPNNFTIRPAQIDDFDGLLRLFERVAEERLWIGTEPGFDQSAYRLGWKRIVEGNVGALFVAQGSDEIIGSLALHPNAEHGYEIGMLVELESRGKGVGSALLREAIEWARQRSEPSLNLYVFTHNSAAIRLYERYGFVEKQRHDSFKKRKNGEEWDVLFMTLSV